MIKAIIFDLNGVFIQSPKLSDRFAQDFGVSPDKFLPILKEIMALVRKPNAGDSFKYWEPYLKEWGVDMNRDQFFEYWFKAEQEVPEMIELVKEIKQKNKELKVLILSNNFIERATYYKKNFKFLEQIFDQVYYSWQTGFIKPDPEAYKKILSDYNLKPEECIYFDDSEKNIKAATGLGIKAFVFDGVKGVKRILD